MFNFLLSTGGPVEPLDTIGRTLTYCYYFTLSSFSSGPAEPLGTIGGTLTYCYYFTFSSFSPELTYFP